MLTYIETPIFSSASFSYLTVNTECLNHKDQTQQESCAGTSVFMYNVCYCVQFWSKNAHTLNFVYEVDDAGKFIVKLWCLFMHFLHNATY